MDSHNDPDSAALDSIGALQQFAEGPTLITGNSAPPESQPLGSPLGEHAGQVIGNFTLIAPIGDGGFGTVWRARQTKPVDREVALKIIKMGMDTREVVARFEQERQAVAMMDHPHVAKVFDAGITPSGRPYFAMEWVNGAPITTWCDKRKLKIAERLRLFMDVCRAVQHAHQKGVIHRDLKPSNILVTEVDGRPMPKLIDFGVAKALDVPRNGETIVFWTASKSGAAQVLDVPSSDGRLNNLHGQIMGSPEYMSPEQTGRGLNTRLGEVMGTPEYMSPEQAKGDARGIDTRTDIFALGVLLYELLTGTTPLDSRTLRSGGVEAMCRLIREAEPELPSKRVSVLGKKDATVAETRQTTSQHLHKAISGDLDWITVKALARAKQERYESIAQFIADLEATLRHDPISARPQSAVYRLRKFVRRHRLPVLIAAGFVAPLITASAVSLWQMKTAEQERANARKTEAAAQHARATAEALINFMLTLDDKRDKLQPVACHDILDQASEEAQKYLQNLPNNQQTPAALSNQGAMFTYLGDVLTALRKLPEAREAYEKALAISESLAQSDSSNAERQRNLSISYARVGDLALSEVNLVKARAAYWKAFEIAETLTQKDATNTLWQQDYGRSCYNLGDLARAEGDLKDARVAYEKYLAISERLAPQLKLKDVHRLPPTQAKALADPEPEVTKLGNHDQWQSIARFFRQRGHALCFAKRNLEAALAWTNFHQQMVNLVEAEPGLPDYEYDLAISCFWKGEGQRLTDDIKGALKSRQEYLGLMRQLVKKRPESTNLQVSLADALNVTGLALHGQNDSSSAAALYREALAILDPMSQAGTLIGDEIQWPDRVRRNLAAVTVQGRTILESLRFADLQLRDQNYVSGAKIRITPSLVSSSPVLLERSGLNYSGTVKSLIERQGPDSEIRTMPAARAGKRYSATGWSVVCPPFIFLGARVFSREFTVDTTGFEPGLYRWIFNYAAPNSSGRREVLDSRSVYFTIHDQNGNVEPLPHKLPHK